MGDCTVRSAASQRAGLAKSRTKANATAIVTRAVVFASPIIDARRAPRMAPSTAGTANRMPSRHSRCPARWKRHAAMAHPMTIGARFEAFATTGSTPTAMRIGRVTADPLEATVLRNAPTKPARMRRAAEVRVPAVAGTCRY